MKKAYTSHKPSIEGFLIVIADDLTGGMDTGACFAMHGFPTLMISDIEMLGNIQEIPENIRALSVNTDSRALDRKAAYRRVSQCVQRLSSLPIHGVYKKIDSTLRGQIGAELDAVMDVLGIPLAFIAPAFPQQGRCTVGGIHLMDGQPIGATEMRHDFVTPVFESSLPALLGAQSRRRTALVNLIQVAAGEHALHNAIRRQTEIEAQLLIFDAARQKHLRSVARAVLSQGWDVCAVGSAGLAREIAGEMGRSRPLSRLNMQKRLSGGPVLAVCGSRSRRSIRQMDRLCEVAGTVRIALRANSLAGDSPFSKDRLNRIAEAVGRALESGSVVLALEIEGAVPTESPHPAMPGRFVKALATVCRLVMHARETPPAGLVLTGGDTALAVLHTMGISMLEIAGEIGPGLPLAFINSGRFIDLPVITKAGAFGGPDALVRSVRYLEKKK